jgi:hypothetical protein
MHGADSGLSPAVLWLGIFLLFLAVGGTITGEGLARTGLVHRSEEPREFWQLIAFYYVLGLGVVGYFVFKHFGLAM